MKSLSQNKQDGHRNRAIVYYCAILCFKRRGYDIKTAAADSPKSIVDSVTEELVRRRAEHNECEIFSLEEVSLHQQDIEKVEHLDRWCRELRILYLQNNLISRIENVGRLKKLEYLNLALNNIEVIENLEGCESLQKLDLTVNFIGRLSSVELLKHNVHLRELYLVGNPCTEFQGYREYVVTALPQLKFLDGTEFSRSERLRSVQGLDQLRVRVMQQEQEYVKRREREREEEAHKESGDKETRNKERKPGFDGRWYTDIPTTQGDVEEDQKTLEEEQAEVDFWQTPCSFTPESRLEAHRHLQDKRRDKNKDKEKTPKPPRTLITADGRVLNANEPKLDFCLTEDEENNTIVLDLAIYRHLDTSLIDVDIQPNYARVTVKGKVFQMVLPAEVKPDSSSAQRSQTTGHLLLTMPRAEGEVKAPKKKVPISPAQSSPAQDKTRNGVIRERLEVDPSKRMDLSNIVHHPEEGPLETRRSSQSQPSVSDSFVDDPDVPPLI